MVRGKAFDAFEIAACDERELKLEGRCNDKLGAHARLLQRSPWRMKFRGGNE